MRCIRVDRSVLANASAYADLDDIDHWLLELDAEGKPLREIAITTAGEPVQHAPIGRNRGAWCDSPVLFQGPEWHDVPLDDFALHWRSTLPKD